MKIVILRGGACRGQPRPGATTRDSGVLAIGASDGPWVLLNISPAVAHQLDSDLRLAARLVAGEERSLVLTDAHLDNVGGLLGLRDGPPIHLYATPAVFEDLTTVMPVLPVLQQHCGVHWHVIPVAGDQRVASFRVEALPELEFTAIASDAPLPVFSAHREHPVVGSSIALAVGDLASGQRVFCAPGLAQIGAFELDWMREADCLLVDGGEPQGLLDEMPARHKVLLAQGADRDALAECGIALAYDGMEIEL
jgi:pyrroloquinoline quinone biosynthesis protein B